MPTIRGQEYQHALIDLQASGTGSNYSFNRFKDVSYEDGAEKKPVMDSQGQIIGYTVDPQKTDGSLSMLLSQWREFKQWLLLQGIGQGPEGTNLGVGQIPFDLTIQYGNTPQMRMSDRLSGAMVQKEPRKSSDDQNALVVEIPLFVPVVLLDGSSFINYR